MADKKIATRAGTTEGKGDKPPEHHVLFICSPLYIEGLTNTEDGRYFGRLLKFRDTLGKWRFWAMPMELLRGSCEELRGELLAAGVEIDTRNRQQLPSYLQWRTPETVWMAATRTGWTSKGGAFVLHDQIIGGERVHFQSESISADGAARVGGDYQQWQQIAAYCENNPVLMTSVCVSLSGALLAKVHRDSGGVHWIGDSSTGKTTALIVGASVWGGDDFKRTWRATSNGLEGAAALLSDTCLHYQTGAERRFRLRRQDCRYRKAIPAHGHTMAASSFKSSAEYQRERRELNRRRGVRRLDIEIEPKLMARLQRELASYGAYTHPGAALVDWLGDVLPE